jgi:hypothetical protein
MWADKTQLMHKNKSEHSVNVEKLGLYICLSHRQEIIPVNSPFREQQMASSFKTE